MDDDRPSFPDDATLRTRILATSGPGESLRVPTDLRELLTNAAMRVVFHDGNEYL